MKVNQLMEMSPKWGSEESIKRVKQEWERYAKEPLEIRFSSGVYDAFGSELATLRLLKAFRNSKKASQEYSPVYKKHVFSLRVQ